MTATTPTPTTDRSHRAGFVRIAAVIASLGVVSWLVVTGSAAVFTDTTDNTGSSFTAGDIALVDDDLGSVLFTVADMEPGETATQCIQVTYQGSIPDPSGVVVYSGGYVDSGDFGTWLNLTIEEGTGATFGDCSTFTLENTIVSGGTLADFDTASTNYATGAGVWDPAGTPESKAYRVTVELDPAAPDVEQGESVTALTLTWETQS